MEPKFGFFFYGNDQKTGQAYPESEIADVAARMKWSCHGWEVYPCDEQGTRIYSEMA